MKKTHSNTPVRRYIAKPAAFLDSVQEQMRIHSNERAQKSHPDTPPKAKIKASVMHKGNGTELQAHAFAKPH